MSYVLSSSSEAVAEPVEPEKRKPDCPVDLSEHPNYQQAVHAFEYYSNNKRSPYHSRQPLHLQNVQAGILTRFRNNAAFSGQEDKARILYVVPFLAGIDEALEQDHLSKAGGLKILQNVKQEICSHISDEHQLYNAQRYTGLYEQDEQGRVLVDRKRILINARQSITHDMNTLDSYARKEGAAFALRETRKPA